MYKRIIEKKLNFMNLLWILISFDMCTHIIMCIHFGGVMINSSSNETFIAGGVKLSEDGYLEGISTL